MTRTRGPSSARTTLRASSSYSTRTCPAGPRRRSPRREVSSARTPMRALPTRQVAAAVTRQGSRARGVEELPISRFGDNLLELGTEAVLEMHTVEVNGRPTSDRALRLPSAGRWTGCLPPSLADPADAMLHRKGTEVLPASRSLLPTRPAASSDARAGPGLPALSDRAGAPVTPKPLASLDRRGVERLTGFAHRP